MLALIKKWIAFLFAWTPYFRNKKRQAEEAEERSRIRREQTLSLKGCVSRFKPEEAEQSEWRHYRYWDFVVKTEEGRNEFYRLCSRLAPPPLANQHCFKYCYQFGKDEVNRRRFHMLFRLVKTYPDCTIVLMGVDTIQHALEDIEDFLLINVDVIDENQKVVERILI